LEIIARCCGFSEPNNTFHRRLIIVYCYLRSMRAVDLIYDGLQISCTSRNQDQVTKVFLKLITNDLEIIKLSQYISNRSNQSPSYKEIVLLSHLFMQKVPTF
jgi:hypothetical protein